MKLSLFVVGAVLVLVPPVLHSQSLADVAKKTEEERAKATATTPSKVYTNNEVENPTVLGRGTVSGGGSSTLSMPAPKASNPDAIPPGHWTMSEDRSPMDDGPIVVVRLEADEPIRAWLKIVRPTLVLRCKEGTLDTFVATETAANVEYGGGHSVQLRFDARLPAGENWSESTAHSALFAPEPELFLNRLRSAEKLTFQFTPFNASPVVVSFDTRGLNHFVNRLIEACPRTTRFKR